MDNSQSAGPWARGSLPAGPEGGQHTPLALLLRWYFDLQCRDIYAFFSYNTDYTVATFYLGLDSLSQTLIFTFFLEGVGGGVQRATLKSSFFHILPFPPFLHLWTLSKSPTSKPHGLPLRPSLSLSECGVWSGPGRPPYPCPQQGRETDPKRSQQDLLPVIPKQSFPKQCLTRLLAWLWSSPQLRGAGAGGGGRGPQKTGVRI